MTVFADSVCFQAIGPIHFSKIKADFNQYSSNFLITLPRRFIKHEFDYSVSEDRTSVKIENLTPEFSCPNVSEIYKNNNSLLDANAFILKEKPDVIEKKNPDVVVIEEKDPDVTQLEIDICSTSISNSQISKKRQLIIMDDDENIQPNALIYPFFEESQ